MKSKEYSIINGGFYIGLNEGFEGKLEDNSNFNSNYLSESIDNITNNILEKKV